MVAWSSFQNDDFDSAAPSVCAQNDVERISGIRTAKRSAPYSPLEIGLSECAEKSVATLAITEEDATVFCQVEDGGEIEVLELVIRPSERVPRAGKRARLKLYVRSPMVGTGD